MSRSRLHLQATQVLLHLLFSRRSLALLLLLSFCLPCFRHSVARETRCTCVCLRENEKTRRQTKLVHGVAPGSGGTSALEGFLSEGFRLNTRVRRGYPIVLS